MIGRLKELTFGRNGEQIISLTVRADARELFDSLKDEDVSIEIKKHRQARAKRSRDANNFCWQICHDIGNSLSPPIPKEDVYRKAIRDVGSYEPLPIRNDAVDEFCQRWASKGIGWFAEIIDDSKIKGYKLVFAYYGSSTYNTLEMSKLIDYLVDEAEQLGISFISQSEIALMKEEWNCHT